jgi:hypothetical protein
MYIDVTFFWDVTQYSSADRYSTYICEHPIAFGFYPEDGGSCSFSDVTTYLPYYIVSYPIK